MVSKWLLFHPVAIKLLALLSSWVFRLWLSTQTFRFVIRARECNPAWMDRPALYVFWHEMLFFPAYTHAQFNVATLVSQHRDGEMLAQGLRMIRSRVVRGSTSRHGVSALRKLIREGQVCHLAIAPDGPKGPRRVVQPGAIFLASRSSMPVIPVGFAFNKCWRANSWDRLAVPRPGEAACAVTGRPIEVPARLTRPQLETYRQLLQVALDTAQAEAERLAAGAKTAEPLLTMEQVQSPRLPSDLSGAARPAHA